MSSTKVNGLPCWVDLQTPDNAVARAFYGPVLGWSFGDGAAEFGGYVMARAGQASTAGIGPMPKGSPMPTAWTVYLATDNVDTTAARVTELGGRVVVPPGDVGTMGRMAIVTDPSGAVFGLWQAGEHCGFPSVRGDGEPHWFEVNTPTGEITRDFLATLFGLQSAPMPGMAYWTLNQGGQMRYGVLQMTEAWEGIAPCWTTYFAVPAVDESAKKVTELGGKVKHGPFNTPFGRIALCSDPAGAIFSIMTPPAKGA